MEFTTEGFGRYGVNELKNIGKGVAMIPEFFGTYPQIKLMEKMKIYTYFFQNGKLPPGNKIFR